jgi:hypothetical protein
MERKGGSTAVVTTEAVATGLKRTSTTSAEEKALRMRYGAKVDLRAPLPMAQGDNEALGDELLLIELELLKALKARKATAVKTTAAPRNVAKAKIVASLKAKKK